MAIITEKQLKKLEELGAKAEEEFKDGFTSLESGNKSVIQMSNIVAEVKKANSS